MWKVFEWFFRAWDSANKVAEKALPNAELQNKQFEIKKQTLEVTELIKRQNKIFNRIKNVPDADVKSYVLEFTDLNEQDTETMVTNITSRIAEYRRDYPIVSGWKRFNKRK